MSIEYNDLPKNLKRYSFESKMRICFLHSLALIEKGKIKAIEKMSTMPSPWELDVFALLSILTHNEYQYYSFVGKDGYLTFIEMINAIRNYGHPLIDQGRILDVFRYGYAAVQFKVQNHFLIRLFRYNYLFNAEHEKISMPAVFKSVFGIPYSEFLDFVVPLYAALSSKKEYPKILSILINKFPEAYSHLSISRSDFIRKQDLQMPDGIDSAYFCFKLFYHYPFISEKNINYFPLPHLLIDSVTDSLLSRLTQHDDTNLRSNIGKHILEGYLFRLISDTDGYCKVRTEILYNAKNKASPDVLALSPDGEYCIMFDSKAIVPGEKLRNFRREDIDEVVRRQTESVIQMYKQIKSFSQYTPFGNIAKDNIFGVIVHFEDPCSDREQIYCLAADSLGLDIVSNDRAYIRSNIRIVSLYEIERFCLLSNRSILINLIAIQKDQSKWNDLTIGSADGSHNKLLWTPFLAYLGHIASNFKQSVKQG